MVTEPGRERPCWPRLLGAIRVAIDARKVVLAALGVLLLLAGWTALDRAFAGRQGPEVLPRFFETSPIDLPIASDRESLLGVLGESAVLVADPYRVPATPFLGLFVLGGGWQTFWQAALAALWSLAVWGPIGGAIARISVLEAAGSAERIGLLTALRFSIGRLGSLLWPPLGALLGLAFFAALCALLGLLYQLESETAKVIAGALAFLPLLAGLIMALILLGLAAGWPLMILTVAAEGEDGFDALSRSYSYATRRPAQYAGSVLLCWAGGVVGLLLLGFVARLVLALAAWGLSFGAPDSEILRLFPPTADSTAGRVHGFWVQGIGLIVYAWIYAYFWSAFAHIYLLLRREIDGTPWEDVYLPEHDADPFAPASPKNPTPNDLATP
ncbi:hypothetical protein BH23PLA1_BH23PLA1_43130 [soil metagenome]